jgi:hypothetical protein
VDSNEPSHPDLTDSQKKSSPEPPTDSPGEPASATRSERVGPKEAAPPRPDLWEPPSFEPFFKPPHKSSLAVAPRPRLLTLIGLILALVGTALAAPYALVASDYFAFPGDVPPPGWEKTIWGVAFFVGTPSLFIGFASLRRERRRRSRLGWYLAAVTVAAAWVGACIWAFPLVLESASGL